MAETQTRAISPGPELQHSTARQFRWYNVLMVLLMSLGSIEYGYNASIISTTLAQPSFISYFQLDKRSDATQLIATTNGLYYAGGFLAVWTVSWMSDRWGRKFAFVVSAFVNLVSAAGLTGSTHIATFIVFRSIAGAGAFMIVTAIPIWMNEVVPPKVRGIFVDCHNVGFLVGYNLATILGYAFYHLPPTNNWGWRGPMIFQALWVVILLPCIRWMPESPRWLMTQDRTEQAERVLARLHNPEEACVEAIQIRQSISAERHLVSSWWSMVSKPSYRKRTILASGMALSIHTSGILVVNNYGPTIYASLGFNTNKQLLFQLGWCFVALGTGFMSFFLIDRFPRPKLLAFGVGGCACCLTIVCGLIGRYASKEALQNPNQPALHAVIAMIYLLNCFYQLGLDGVQFAYLGEIFPTHLRAKGMVVGVATICAINILWLQLAPMAFKSIGYKFYMVFFIPGYICTAILWFLYPDTLGIPLEDIARIFGDHGEQYGNHDSYEVETKERVEMVEDQKACSDKAEAKV
ncbi:hypothetical protein PV05_04548 [Exophiala xenobiotica]|uniref:Major facilitator superfamily (MFS) profile domain-containing protein n=1 Tax=Exophiala xenobiotica TaxID=348802 RepID=A0A0D2F741_9EURO|nr:uncharacterized protein PV05_04548 [Exophiala xenobiotica]KIW55829.1 hypothetical protein PV05_04548 [Exophiala xenobiotica]